jgi:hypothetical protein
MGQSATHAMERVQLWRVWAGIWVWSWVESEKQKWVKAEQQMVVGAVGRASCE